MHALPLITYSSTKPICHFFQDDTIHEYHIFTVTFGIDPSQVQRHGSLFIFMFIESTSHLFWMKLHTVGPSLQPHSLLTLPRCSDWALLGTTWGCMQV